MNKKNKLISLLASIGCVALSAGVGAQFTMAQAEGKTIGNVDVSSFRMSYGAEMRFDPNNTEDPIGIRFSATLADKAYEDLEKLDGVNYGMVIVPADIVKNKPLTEENLFGQDALYCFEDPKQGEETEGCTCSKQHVASVEYAVLSNAKKDDGVRNLRGSLVNILPANLTREYVGLGYIEYNGAYVLADYASGENDQVPDIKNNTRSVTYVAQRAIDNNQDDADETLKETFVDTQSGKQFKYTVNHYLPKEEGGYTTVTETLGGTLGAEVTATHITKGNLAADYKAYKLYNMTAEGNPKDVLYANGRTTLNCYYEKVDTTLLTCDVDELTTDAANNQYTYLEHANRAYGFVDSETGIVNHEEITIGGETRQGVTQITFSGENNAYFSGKLHLALPNEKVEQMAALDWGYIKVSLLVEVDNGETTLTMGSHNNKYNDTIQAGVWEELIITKSELNQKGNFMWYSVTPDGTKANFDSKFANSYFKNSQTAFINCYSVKTSLVDTAAGETDTVTYYIDKIEWGIDTTAPTINVSGVGSEMFEGTFNEPTVTVTDDYTIQSRLNAKVEKTLYKVEGETRTPVAFTDGKVDLTKGSYVYVVKATDAIFDDVEGNTATKEVAFEIVEKQDVVITFDSSDDVKYIQKNSSKTYYAETTYLTADELATEGLNAGAITPEDGVLKFVAGMEGSTDANGTNGTAMYGAWLNFVLTAEELALISDATAVTIRMYVKTSHPNPNWSNDENPNDVEFFETGNGKASYTGCNRGEWVDLTITADELSKNFLNYFNGTDSIFWTSTNTTYDKTAVITYYINSITFDVTP